MGPPRLAVPETPMVYASVAPEAPRPHVVKLDLDNDIEEHHYQVEAKPVQQTPLVVQHQNLPATVVKTQNPRLIHRTPIVNRGPPIEHTASAVVHRPEAPRPHVVRLEQRRRPVVRVEQAPVRVHSTPRFQPSSLQVKPSAEDLTFLISQQITQSIRNRIPTILSNLQAKQSKQTKAVQPSVSRVT